MAVIRGFTRHTAQTIGNFWVDMTRSVLYILIPLALVLAIVLMSQGVVQTLRKYKTDFFWSIRLQLFSKCSFNPMSVIGYDVG
jgi:K+-transporting ATPase A subunit